MDQKKVAEDVNDSAVAAKVHFDHWWALAGEARGDLKDTMRTHADYFIGVWDAHYVAFYVYLAHLFDRRKDSSSIPTYLRILERKLGMEAVKALRAEFELISNRAEPLLVARPRTVAHVDATLSQVDVFSKFEIIWDDVHALLEDTAAFVAKMQGMSSPNDYGAIGQGVIRDATFKILRKLGAG